MVASATRRPDDKRETSNPEATRLAIVEAALKLLAEDDAAAFSVKAAARAAGVNRGTAYFHFGSREKLVSVAIEHAGRKINAKLYGLEHHSPNAKFHPDRIVILEEMALFLIQNPQLSRIWLSEVFGKGRLFSEPLTRNARDSVKEFSSSPFGEDNIDPEIFTIMTFGTYLLWSIALEPKKLSPVEQKKMAARIVTEILRMSLFGSIIKDMAPELTKAVRERMSAG